jgi:hypothetical protein
MRTFLPRLLLAGALWTAPVATVFSQSYTFTTIAGSPGLTGTADGTNGAARFYYPSMNAVDSAGNIYVSDNSNETIRKVAPIGPNWVVTTLAGQAGTYGTNDGIGTQAQFYKPNGVALDNGGNLYVVDHYGHTIRRVAPLGTNWVVTTLAGLGEVHGYADGTNSNARFWSPTGIAVDGATNLYVTDTENYVIRKVAPVGTNWVVTTIAGTAYNYGLTNGVGAAAAFDNPTGIAVDSATNLYVADWGNNVIRKMTLQGGSWVVSTIVGDLEGNPGSADGTNHNAQFNGPNGIAVDQSGNLYVTDQYNDTIRKITPVGANWVVSTIGGLAGKSGTANGIGSNARFYDPWGIAVGSSGNVFVVDWPNQTIRAGVPAATAPPALAIAGSAGEVLLSWPLSASAFVLQTSPTLSSGGVWSPLTNGVSIFGNSFVLTNNPTGAAAFYRLCYAP